MDINCDLGESLEFLENGKDEKLMQYVTSINVACGFHAGDVYIMKKTIENALKYDLKIGAHPGFDNKANFGREEIEMSEQEIIDLVTRQLEIITGISRVKLYHVKPHGALYNMSAYRKDYARAIAKAVLAFDSNLILFGMSGTESVKTAREVGLEVYEEVFADRAYHCDGRLMSRKLPGAVLSDKIKIKEQVLALKSGQAINCDNNGKVLLAADTICIHSDSPGAIEIAALVQKLCNQD